jgi:hypothetical protein
MRDCQDHAPMPWPSADGHGMGWAGKFKFYGLGEDNKQLFSTSHCFPLCLVVSPLSRRFSIFGGRAWMQSYSMSIRGSYCAPNANGKEAEVARFRGPMSRDRTTPTAGTEGRNTHQCSEQCETACKKVSATNRDSEDASSEAEPCPGQDTPWIGAYEQSYLERKWIVLQRYRDALQIPPDGPFTYKDIKWEYRPPNMQNSMGKR